MPAVAATNPPVLIGLVAGATRRMRVGSGGVMLPNHAPLVVAEQFALLEAAYPGRIDLGIGRAPGTDPVTSFALRHGAGGVTDEAVSRFPEYVDNILAMMEPGGVGLGVAGRTHVLKATPVASSVPEVWLLGLLGLLGAAGGREGPALRLRPPLLGQRHRRGARALPLDVPALARAGPSRGRSSRSTRWSRRPARRPSAGRCPTC